MGRRSLAERLCGRRASRPPAALLGLLILLPFLVAWADSLEGLRRASVTITSVEAAFVQKKTLAILARPLLSEGRFYFRAPDSLRWEYEKPIRSVLLVHEGTVKRFVREGNGWREDAGGSPATMQIVLEQIGQWQQGRFDANPHFRAAFAAGPPPRVLLEPREAGWQKLIRRIELTLSRDQVGVIETVRMVEDEQTFTLLEFNRVRLNRALPAAFFTDVR
jgi:hypothetical protein